MPLPTITTSEDIVDILNYLKTKATGVSLDDARAAIDGRLLDSRKIAAYKYWGFLEKDSEKLALSETGWDFARRPEKKAEFFRDVIREVKPYYSVLEWVHFQILETLSIVDVVRHWSKNFPGEVESEESAKDQAACFFRLCEGAELGKMVIGRRGSPTRLEVQKDTLAEFITGETITNHNVANSGPKAVGREESIIEPTGKAPSNNMDAVEERPKTDSMGQDFYKRVYISHGRNRSFVDPIRRLLAFGHLEAVVSVQAQSTSVPVPEKVMEDMRSCGAAIIHVDSEEILTDKDGKERILLNQNVLIEIGAAMALYGKRYILLVKDGVTLPSNLQGLYEVRYPGNVLDSDTTIRLMEAIGRLTQERIPE